MDAFHIVNPIGARGSRSTSFKARIKRELSFVCIKRSALSHLPQLEQTVAIHGTLRAHVNVLNFRAWYATPRHVYRVLELAAGGALRAVVASDRGAPEDALRLFGSDLVRGLLHVHASGVALGVLTPDGVLLDEDGSLKIGCFDCARRFARVGARDADTRPIDPAVTPLAYTAPEIVASVVEAAGGPEAMRVPSGAPAPSTTARATVSADLWSLGIVLWELASGRRPFGEGAGEWDAAAGEVAAHARGSLADAIARSTAPLPLDALLLPSPQGIAAHESPAVDDFDAPESTEMPRLPASKSFAHLLTRLLERNPRARATWREVLSHPFWCPPSGGPSAVPSPDAAEIIEELVAQATRAAPQDFAVSVAAATPASDSAAAAAHRVSMSASPPPPGADTTADDAAANSIAEKERIARVLESPAPASNVFHNVEQEAETARGDSNDDDGISLDETTETILPRGEETGGGVATVFRYSASRSSSIVADSRDVDGAVRSRAAAAVAAPSPADTSATAALISSSPDSSRDSTAALPACPRALIWSAVLSTGAAADFRVSAISTLARTFPVRPDALTFQQMTLSDAEHADAASLSLYFATVREAIVGARAQSASTDESKGAGTDDDFESSDADPRSARTTVAVHHSAQLSALAHVCALGSSACARVADAALMQLSGCLARLLVRSSSAAVAARAGATLANLLGTATGLEPRVLSRAPPSAPWSLYGALAGVVGIPAGVALSDADGGPVSAPSFASTRQAAAAALGELIFYAATQAAAESALGASPWNLPAWVPVFLAAHIGAGEADAIVRRTLLTAVTNVAALAPAVLVAADVRGVGILLRTLATTADAGAATAFVASALGHAADEDGNPSALTARSALGIALDALASSATDTLASSAGGGLGSEGASAAALVVAAAFRDTDSRVDDSVIAAISELGGAFENGALGGGLSAAAVSALFALAALERPQLASRTSLNVEALLSSARDAINESHGASTATLVRTLTRVVARAFAVSASSLIRTTAAQILIQTDELTLSAWARTRPLFARAFGDDVFVAAAASAVVTSIDADCFADATVFEDVACRAVRASRGVKASAIALPAALHALRVSAFHARVMLPDSVAGVAVGAFALLAACTERGAAPLDPSFALDALAFLTAAHAAAPAAIMGALADAAGRALAAEFHRCRLSTSDVGCLPVDSGDVVAVYREGTRLAGDISDAQSGALSFELIVGALVAAPALSLVSTIGEDGGAALLARAFSAAGRGVLLDFGESAPLEQALGAAVCLIERRLALGADAAAAGAGADAASISAEERLARDDALSALLNVAPLAALLLGARAVRTGLSAAALYFLRALAAFSPLRLAFALVLWDAAAVDAAVAAGALPDDDSGGAEPPPALHALLRAAQSHGGDAMRVVAAVVAASDDARAEAIAWEERNNKDTGRKGE